MCYPIIAAMANNINLFPATQSKSSICTDKYEFTSGAVKHCKPFAIHLNTHKRQTIGVHQKTYLTHSLKI